MPDGLTAAELGRRTAPVALAARAKPLNGDLLAPFATAGLIERRGRTWVLLPDPAIRAAFGPDAERRLPLDGDDLDLPKRGPALGTPRPPRPRERIAS